MASNSQFDRHMQDLPSNRILGTLTILDRVVNDGIIKGSHARLVEALSLIAAYMRHHGLNDICDRTIERNGEGYTSREKCLAALENLRIVLGTELPKRLSEFGMQQFGHLFSDSLYEFRAEECDTIQNSINTLRNQVAGAEYLDELHKKRLLAKLEALQAELHIKMTNLEKFWDAMMEGYLVMAEYGDRAKNIFEPLFRIADIALKRKAETEGRTINVQFAIGKNNILLPPPTSAHSADTQKT